jgi:hypothetical protein
MDLEDLKLDLDIGSSEGLSVDQMTRSRLQFLLGQNAYIIGQMRFADAKAGTLLAIVGVLAIIVTDRQTEMNAIFFSAYILVTMLVVATCLIALMPRVPSDAEASEMRKTDLFSWPSLSSDTLDVTKFATLMRTSDASLLVVSVSKSNLSLARVLRVKYRLLRVAFLLALIDLVALGTTLMSPLL